MIATNPQTIKNTPFHKYIQKDCQDTFYFLEKELRKNAARKTCELRLIRKDGELVEASSYKEFQRNQLFLDEMSSFLDMLDGKNVALVNLREAARSLRMALAAKESIETGRVIKYERQEQ